MRAIRLTQGYEAIVDDDVAALIEMLGVTPRALVYERGIYAGWDRPAGQGRGVIAMHRWILGDPPGMHIDHRDGIGLHNWMTNLREATVSQNRANSDVAWGVDGCRGVSSRGKTKVFRAKIVCKKVRYDLGTFPTIAEASAAYRAKRIELFGEFSPDVCR